MTSLTDWKNGKLHLVTMNSSPASAFYISPLNLLSLYFTLTQWKQKAGPSHPVRNHQGDYIYLHSVF